VVLRYYADLVFQAATDGNWDIHVVNADGTNQTNITNQPGDENSPAWSPDGTEILAFLVRRKLSPTPRRSPE
jgi:Tol biopolymer transport system component